MSSFSIDTSAEFLSALLHGWWANGAHGGRLEELARSGTVEVLVHQLAACGLAGEVRPETVLAALALRKYSRLVRLGRLCSPAAGAFMAALRARMHYENVKLLLNYRFFPERVGAAEELVIPFPDAPHSRSEIHALLAAPTTAEFIRLMTRGGALFAPLRPVIEQLDRDHDIMRAGNAIDNIAFAATLSAASALPSSLRGAALDLVCMQIDGTNAITLLRNADFYHMDGETLAGAWIDGGRELSRHLRDALAGASDRRSVLAALPRRVAAAMAPQADDSIPVLENRLQRHCLRRARQYFCDAGSPELAVVAYPVLLHFETVNLGRICEGVRFSLPVEAICDMLVV